MPYDPKRIEPRWQATWREHATFRAEIDPRKPKYYVLDMFPYPSGAGLHVGHPKGYIATDVLARFKRMRGFSVLHPMGWDAFGLPAEQYAIETGTHPRVTTRRNIETFKRQIDALGFSYDWSREIDTTDPGYYRWTQWIFCKLFERGLAYEAEVAVNWCPALGTVLANEEVIDGKSERGGHPVVRLPMKQWMLRITAYADRLIADLDGVDWPEPIKKMQRDWIGRSEGAQLRFPVADHTDLAIEVFTTRPDTLFGATYMVLAPEHALVGVITTPAQRSAVAAYVEAAARRSERARVADAKTKTGVATGAFAVNPGSGERIPIWIADYVLAGYGTGAIMAVPAHDERDFEFAGQWGLPIRKVVDVKGQELPSTGEGVSVASGFISGLPTAQAKRRIIDWIESESHGKGAVTYKLRDWLFSRQRYWGEPFPVLHLEDGSVKLVGESELPLRLPELDDFRPVGDRETPLERATDWIVTTDPATGRPARRDRNTMPQWAGSCWYFLRFVDPRNDTAPFSPEAERYWMPVDLYVGGAEHAVLHLLYARFWHKVLYDLGLVHTVEPFQKLVNQGMILGASYRYFDDNISDDPSVNPRRYSFREVRASGEGSVASSDGRPVRARFVPNDQVQHSGDGGFQHASIPGLELEEVIEKMSKSRGNVVNPDEVVAEFGADSLRLYELFLGPIDKEAPWTTEGILGVFRFLQRSWRLLVDEDAPGEPARSLPEGIGTPAQARLLATTVQGVSDDVEAMRFNTAIAKLMVFVRDIARDAPIARDAADAFVRLLAPFAPHIAEELWERLGHRESIAYAPWPAADPALLVAETVTIAVQVNGKRRAEVEVAANAGDDALRAAALADANVQRHLEGRTPRKVIVVKGRLVNIVI
ncbi:MAG: leucyl-tRNA synthetase [Deltaproteobacteria bacterium]|nr:leucyl-tRNA synthetase [Deltaproteobacteria bacterium]